VSDTVSMTAGTGGMLSDAEAAFARYEAVRSRLPAARFPRRSRLLPSLEEVADQVDGFLLDAFGVLNVGETAIPGAVARLASLRARGKRLVVVDDSIVRGTTSRKIVRLIRQAGAREVHVRISSPPVDGPCYYGIDTPNRAELVASSQSIEEINRTIEADSLGYLSPEGLRRAVRADGVYSYCDACFTGDYPIPPGRLTQRRQLRLIEV